MAVPMPLHLRLSLFDRLKLLLGWRLSVYREGPKIWHVRIRGFAKAVAADGLPVTVCADRSPLRK